MSSRDIIQYDSGGFTTSLNSSWQYLNFINSPHSINNSAQNGDKLNSVKLQLYTNTNTYPNGGTVLLELYETSLQKHGDNISGAWGDKFNNQSEKIAISNTVNILNNSSLMIAFTFIENVFIDLTKFYYIKAIKTGSVSVQFLYISPPNNENPTVHVQGGTGGHRGFLNHIVNVSTLNNPPTANVSIELNSNILIATVITADVDGDNVTVSYQWKKNGNNINGETNSTLNISNTLTGDNINVTVSVTPNDGIIDGQIVDSNQIIINQLDNLNISLINQSFINELNNIIITSPINNVSIYYTTDGSNPTNQSTEYTSPITINQTTELKTIGYKDGCSPSNILQRTYTKLSNYLVSSEVDEGNIKSNNNISLLSNNVDENIYYTIDGVNPTEQSNKYTSPFKITTIGDIILKIVAIGPSLLNRPIMSYNYTVTDWLNEQTSVHGLAK